MKGDFVRVVAVRDGVRETVTIEAVKQGRRVERKTTTGKVRWVEIREVTRGGRPTGTSLSVPLDAVLTIQDFRDEP